MTDDVTRLQAEVDAESAEDVFTDEVIATLKADVQDLRAALEEVQPALEAAQSGEAEAKAELEQVLQAVRDAADKLAADNPRADNTLPGAGSEGGAQPDNTLPNELPTEGEPPVINPLGGRGSR